MESEIICKARNGKKIQLVSCVPNIDNPDCKKCNSHNKIATQKQESSSEPSSVSISNNSKYGKRSSPTSKEPSQLSKLNQDSLAFVQQHIGLLESKKYCFEKDFDEKDKRRLEHLYFLSELVKQGFDLDNYNRRKSKLLYDLDNMKSSNELLKTQRQSIEGKKRKKDFDRIVKILKEYSKWGPPRQDVIEYVYSIILAGYRRDSTASHLVGKGVSIKGATTKKDKASSWPVFDVLIKYTVEDLLRIKGINAACKDMLLLLKFNFPEEFSKKKEGEITWNAIKKRYERLLRKEPLDEDFYNDRYTPSELIFPKKPDNSFTQIKINLPG